MTMKYLLKTALCLLLCALLSLPALAEEGEVLTCGDYTYVLLEDGGARITGYDGEDAELTVPAELDGHPVREIGNDAFYGCESLTAVTLPIGLTSIGENPFRSSDLLAKINVSPDDPVFAQIDGVLYEKATKTLISYPAGKEGNSFAVPDGILAIGDRAFIGCDSLTTVTLPEGLTSIGDSAFSSCFSLTSITLPEGLTSIGANPFHSCDSLEKIDVSPDHPVFAQIDGVLYEKATKTLICYPAGKEGDSFDVPDGILAIGDRAFSGCDSLTSVTLPDSLTSIGDGAFYRCSFLTTATLPEGLTSIGENAFSYCETLTTITLPEGLTSIGDYAFSYCESLTTVTLPDSLISIGDYAFWNSPSDLTLTVPRDSYACQYAIDNGLAYTYPDANAWLYA